jgi:hypothetical protein
MSDFLQVIGDYLADSWDMLVGRTGGPFKLRLILQPTVAALLAIRAGLADARAGRPPYLWAIKSADDEHDRRKLFRDGFGDVKKVFFIALALDIVYEIVVYRWVYPVQALIMAIVLALIPYLCLRGIVTRLARSRRSGAGK